MTTNHTFFAAAALAVFGFAPLAIGPAAALAVCPTHAAQIDPDQVMGLSRDDLAGGYPSRDRYELDKGVFRVADLHSLELLAAI